MVACVDSRLLPALPTLLCQFFEAEAAILAALAAANAAIPLPLPLKLGAVGVAGALDGVTDLDFV